MGQIGSRCSCMNNKETNCELYDNSFDRKPNGFTNNFPKVKSDNVGINNKLGISGINIIENPDYVNTQKSSNDLIYNRNQ